MHTSSVAQASHASVFPLSLKIYRRMSHPSVKPEDLSSQTVFIITSRRVGSIGSYVRTDPIYVLSGLLYFPLEFGIAVYFSAKTKVGRFLRTVPPYPRGIKPISRQTMRARLPSSRAEKIKSPSAVPGVGGRSKSFSKEIRRRRRLFRTIGRPSTNST